MALETRDLEDVYMDVEDLTHMRHLLVRAYVQVHACMQIMKTQEASREELSLAGLPLARQRPVTRSVHLDEHVDVDVHVHVDVEHWSKATAYVDEPNSHDQQYMVEGVVTRNVEIDSPYLARLTLTRVPSHCA